jgi:signal transduction histidine kinase
MSSATMPGRAPGAVGRSWLAGGFISAGQGLVLGVLALAGAALLAGFGFGLMVVGRLVIGHWPGWPGLHDHEAWLLFLPVVVLALPALRGVVGLTRRLAWRWCGLAIPAPYRVPRSRPEPLRRRAARLVTDPASWRDLLWAIANGCGGFLVAAGPALLIVGGLALMIIPVLTHLPTGAPMQAHALPHPTVSPAGSGGLSAPGSYRPSSSGTSGMDGNILAICLPGGLALLLLGLWTGPRLLPAYGAFALGFLGPTRQTELTHRVEFLAQTRSESVDASAAELRRIERDLHDGAQARLVAMGMTLDAADQLLDSSPEAARALLAEARASSARALAELRDLVRGIHPPVLADRGLAEAIRALALDAPFGINVVGELTGRAPEPVETAAYFAVSELLANVSKHAGARRAWIDLRHEAGMLSITVTDDGCGGVDPGRGTGLRGIERRLAMLDGVLAVSSPPGGPTVVNMEIPCALSSPKTFSC